MKHPGRKLQVLQGGQALRGRNRMSSEAGHIAGWITPAPSDPVGPCLYQLKKAKILGCLRDRVQGEFPSRPHHPECGFSDTAG